MSRRLFHMVTAPDPATGTSEQVGTAELTENDDGSITWSSRMTLSGELAEYVRKGMEPFKDEIIVMPAVPSPAHSEVPISTYDWTRREDPETTYYRRNGW